MAKYAKNQIGEDFYLKRMGAMSLRLARVAHKTTTTVKAQNVPGLVDSLSETRPMPESDETDSFSDNDHQYGNDALTCEKQILSWLGQKLEWTNLNLS